MLSDCFFVSTHEIMSTQTINDYESLSEAARRDLLAHKTDITLLKYLQGQVKEHVKLSLDENLQEIYAENNLVIIDHVFSQLKSNIEFKRTKELPLKELSEIAGLIAQLPDSIGFNTLSQPKQDKMFVQMTNLILSIISNADELSIESKAMLYNALFSMAATHKDYLGRHTKVDRVIKEKIQKLRFSENEIEKSIGLKWFRT